MIQLFENIETTWRIIVVIVFAAFVKVYQESKTTGFHPFHTTASLIIGVGLGMLLADWLVEIWSIDSKTGQQVVLAFTVIFTHSVIRTGFILFEDKIFMKELIDRFIPWGKK